jgi:hypothetical protein
MRRGRYTIGQMILTASLVPPRFAFRRSWTWSVSSAEKNARAATRKRYVVRYLSCATARRAVASAAHAIAVELAQLQIVSSLPAFSWPTMRSNQKKPTMSAAL